MFYKNRHHRKNGHNRRHILNIIACERQKAGLLAFWHISGSLSTQISPWRKQLLCQKLRSKLVCIYPLDFYDNGMIHVCHFWILMALSSFLTLGRHRHQDRLWRAELFLNRTESFQQMGLTLEDFRGSWRTIVLLLQTSQIFGLFLKDCLFETTEVFPKWQPNKKPNFSIKLWTPRIRALISVPHTTESDHSQSFINSL